MCTPRAGCAIWVYDIKFFTIECLRAHEASLDVCCVVIMELWHTS